MRFVFDFDGVVADSKRVYVELWLKGAFKGSPRISSGS